MRHDWSFRAASNRSRKARGSYARRLSFESLEGRRMLADGAANDIFNAGTGVLTLNLNGADSIDAVSILGGFYFIDGVFRPDVAAANVRRIVTVANAGSGANDTVRFEGGVPFDLANGVLINGNIEFIDIRTEIRGVTTNAIQFNANANPGGINLGADLRTVGRAVNINRDITLTADVQIVTDNPGTANPAGLVNLVADIDGFRNLTINASSDVGASGAINIGDDVGRTTALASFTAISNGTGVINWATNRTIQTDGGKVELNAGTVNTTTGAPYVIDTELGGNNNGGNVVLTGNFVDTTPLGRIQVDVTGGAANTPGTVTVPAGFNNTGIVGGFDVYINNPPTYQIEVKPPGVAGNLFNENFNAPLVNPNLANLVTRSGTFFQSGNSYVGLRPGYLGKAVATIESLTLPAHYEVQATVNMNPAGNGIFSNGFIIFDYQSPTNFKFAGAFVGRKTFSIGQVTNGTMNYLIETAAPTLAAGVNVNLRLDINGATATLFNGATQVAQRTFTAPFTGKVGFGTDNANTTFDNIVVRSA